MMANSYHSNHDFDQKRLESDLPPIYLKCESDVDESDKLNYESIKKFIPLSCTEHSSSNDSPRFGASTSPPSIATDYSQSKSVRGLKTELSLDSKKRPYFKCQLCPKEFSNSSAIAKHKLTHSDERRYSCDQCGKSFKRQDHLNGHKNTHKTNKPHACTLCDRSYSDARSLRRHYESQHQDECHRRRAALANVGSDSIGAGSSLSESDALDLLGSEWPGADSHMVQCEVCTRGFRNQAALNGHMRLHGGYGVGKHCIRGPGEPRFHQSTAAASAGTGEGSVDHNDSANVSIMSNNDLPMGTMDEITMCLPMSSYSMPNLSPNPVSQIDKSASAFPSPQTRTLDLNFPSNPNISHQHHQQHQQHQPQQLPSLYSNQQAEYSPITPSYKTTTNSNNLSGSLATHIDFLHNNEDTKFANMYDGPSIHDGEALSHSWLSMTDVSQPISQTPQHSSSSTLAPVSSSDNLQELIINLESLSNHTDDWSRITLEPQQQHQQLGAQSPPRLLVPLTYTTSLQDHLNSGYPINSHDPFSDTVTSTVSTTDSSVKKMPNLNSSMPVSHLSKKKSRPAPIFIPPQTSAHMSRLRSPAINTTAVGNNSSSTNSHIPPYTPPPMLSPHRKGSGLFNSVFVHSCNFRTPSNGMAANPTSVKDNYQVLILPEVVETNRKTEEVYESKYVDVKQEPQHFLYHEECLDNCHPQSREEKDGLLTSAEPRINIGLNCQAVIPPLRPKSQLLKEDKRIYDTLLWHPKHLNDTGENLSSLDLLMKIASSSAVKSCGLNMEYTFHLLFKFKGDLEKTLQVLLEESFVVYDYVYAETTNWTTSEISQFQENLREHDRDFKQVSLALRNCGMDKSVKACVEFYYVWKQMSSSKDTAIYRNSCKSRKKTSRSAQDENNNPSATNTAYLPLNTAEPSVNESGYNLRNKYSSNSAACNHPLPSTLYRDPSGSPQSPAAVSSSSLLSFKSYSGAPSAQTTGCHYDNSVSNTVENVDDFDYDFSPNHVTAPLQHAKKSRPYHCNICKKTFVKQKNRDNHLKKHSQSTAYYNRSVIDNNKSS